MFGLLFDFTAVGCLAVVVLIMLFVFIMYCVTGNKVDAREKEQREQEHQEYLARLMEENAFRDGKSKIFKFDDQDEPVESVDEADLERAADALLNKEVAGMAAADEIDGDLVEKTEAAPADEQPETANVAEKKSAHRQFNVEAAMEAAEAAALRAQMEAALGTDSAVDDRTIMIDKLRKADSGTIIADRPNKAEMMAAEAARVAEELGVDFEPEAQTDADEAIPTEPIADIEPTEPLANAETENIISAQGYTEPEPVEAATNAKTGDQSDSSSLFGSDFHFKSDPRLTGKINQAGRAVGDGVAAAGTAAGTAAAAAAAGATMAAATNTAAAGVGQATASAVSTGVSGIEAVGQGAAIGGAVGLGQNIKAANQAECVVKPEKPLAFGYKMAWLAIPNVKPAAIIDALELKNIKPANWTGGLTAAYDDTKELFVTPQVHGWVLVVGKGLWTKIDLDTPAEQNSWLQQLGKSLPEIYYFSSMRTLGNYAWLYMKNGEIVRAYGLSSELGEVMWDVGSATAAEISANIGFVTGNAAMMVDEKTVLAVAAGWTISTTFDTGDFVPDIGFIGNL